MKIQVPATSANLGPGFDSCGIALAKYLVIEVIKPQYKWEIVHHLGPEIPSDESNLLIQTALSIAPYLVPHAQIPEQLWQVDPKKIVGLTNDPAVLNGIRKERMRAYGLDPDTAYSDIDKIKEELEFANKLYEKLGCIVINVATLSIEETASMILNELNLEDHSYFITDSDSQGNQYM